MVPEADVCLIVEGGYPYILGGVASWMDALIRASAGLKFHIIAIAISSQPRARKFTIPDNVVGLTDVILDVSPTGRRPAAREEERVRRGVRLMQSTIAGNSQTSFRDSSNSLTDRVRTGWSCSIRNLHGRRWSVSIKRYCRTHRLSTFFGHGASWHGVCWPLLTHHYRTRVCSMLFRPDTPALSELTPNM